MPDAARPIQTHLLPIRPQSAPEPPDVVNAALTSFVGSRATGCGVGEGMETPFISGRTALADAAALLAQFGTHAAAEAAARAAGSRDAGNVARFCHWRQIERVIATLSSGEVAGTIH